MSSSNHRETASEPVAAARRFATAATRAAHEQALRELPPDDPLDEQDVRRGFIGTIPDAEVRDAYGRLVWSLGDYGFLDEPQAPQTAHPALDLHLQHRPARPVVAVIYSHSHADHFGGAKGVADVADVRAGKIAVIAPEGFMEEAVSENILAGTAMMRRAQFQFGQTLERNACCRPIGMPAKWIRNAPMRSAGSATAS